MQRFSIRLMLLMVVLILSGAFTRASHATLAATPSANRFINYYWYTVPDDTYNDYNSATAEAWEWWILYDEPVNTDPAGGTLIVEGFINETMPHEFPPSVFLYVHPN